MKNLAQIRLRDLRRTLKQAELDGYITTAYLEQRYLSGIDLSDGEAVFLITPAKAYCITKKLIVSKMTPAASFIKTVDVPFGGMVDGALKLIEQKKY